MTDTGGRGVASLSLDLDNQWSYLKTHGDERWEALPSYLDDVVPVALGILADLGLRITFFVVGLDAERSGPDGWLGAIAAAGHEVGNHSYAHEPWLHLYDDAEIEAELDRTERAIEAGCGVRPTGFRGPGYSLSPALLRRLKQRGYAYDASTLPTWIGPLARAYYFRSTKLEEGEREKRSQLFGTFADGVRPVTPYRWDLDDGPLIEIPVTTFPVARVPMHISYVLYLEQHSSGAARAFFRAALASCDRLGVGPSVLLHPLDVLGGDDLPTGSGLEFFPGMTMAGGRKRALVRDCLLLLRERFDVGSVGRHARSLEAADLPLRAAPPAPAVRAPVR